jgi:hypothetical protein
MVGSESTVGSVVIDYQHGASSVYPIREAAQPAPARRVQGDEQLRSLRNLVW